MSSLWFLLIAHFLGDFLFQPSEWAEKKQAERKYLLYHVITYSSVVCIALLLSINVSPCGMLAAFILLVISHSIIDKLKICYNKKDKIGVSEKIYAFVIDQVLHILIILLMFHVAHFASNTSLLFQKLEQYFPLKNICIYILMAVVLIYPASVLIKILMDSQPKCLTTANSKDADKTVNNEDADKTVNWSAGKSIGVLERLIICILVLNDEISAIGFVLTAKSIAREPLI